MLSIFDLTGETAVITGAGRGIGRGIAHLFAQAGANVVLAARREEELQSVADEINAMDGPAKAVWQKTDVSIEEEMDALGQRAIDEFGRLDIWVNNAGGSLVSAPLTELPLEEWEWTLRVNLTSIFFGVRAAQKHMGENSRILNISSGAAVSPFPGSGHYSAAKAGVNILTKTLAHELGPKTRVNAIMPGFVPTETVKTALSMEDEDFGPLLESLNLPVGRLGTPEDIGACALYLCSAASDWVTGQCLAVSGTS